MQLYTSLPGDINEGEKFILGIYSTESDYLLGVFELVEHYRNYETLTIALMMIEPEYRSQGLGHLAHSELESMAIDRNMNILRIGVLLGNKSGYRFWLRMGYQETGEVKAYREHGFVVMEKKMKDGCDIA